MRITLAHVELVKVGDKYALRVFETEFENLVDDKDFTDQIHKSGRILRKYLKAQKIKAEYIQKPKVERVWDDPEHFVVMY